MGKPISNVTIVGGGTAGWLTALILQNHLAKASPKDRRPLVTLIESPNVPTVGVGEATVPGMPRTLQVAGVSEQEFFKTCNASFKLGVLFANWNHDKAGKPIDFVNPFARVQSINGVNAGYYFLEHGAKGLDFSQIYTPAIELGRACKGPRPLGSNPFDNRVGNAYHMDAGKFAGMLQKICTDRGVRHLRENVVKVDQDERGYVTALELEETGSHPVELVIDCTGFRGVIINEVMKEPFINYSKYLANDRAMAVQIPHPDPAKIPSLTRSYALGAGWVWRVPLYNRIGTGYVFSSAHRTDEQARDEFVAHLGDTWNGVEPRVIPMRIGRNRNAWVKNVVAVGLSGGFIEPLESTAIHMIDTAVRWLTTYFPDDDFADPLRNRFNKLMGQLYDEIRDFIVLHYALGNRTDDQYWIDARTELEVPDSLATNLELWRHTLPGPYDLDFDSFFSVGVYHAVLMGKRVYETDYAAPSIKRKRGLNPEPWQHYLKQARGSITKTVGHMADHKTLLTELRGELEAPSFANVLASQATVSVPGAPPPKLTVPTPKSDASTEPESASLL